MNKLLNMQQHRRNSKLLYVWKRPDTKGCTLCDSIYIKVYNRQKLICHRWKQKSFFDGSISYIERNVSYMGVCICQKSFWTYPLGYHSPRPRNPLTTTSENLFVPLSIFFFFAVVLVQFCSVLVFCFVVFYFLGGGAFPAFSPILHFNPCWGDSNINRLRRGQRLAAGCSQSIHYSGKQTGAPLSWKSHRNTPSIKQTQNLGSGTLVGAPPCWVRKIILDRLRLVAWGSETNPPPSLKSERHLPWENQESQLLVSTRSPSRNSLICD